jgi:hypothetical protein
VEGIIDLEETFLSRSLDFASKGRRSLNALHSDPESEDRLRNHNFVDLGGVIGMTLWQPQDPWRP